MSMYQTQKPETWDQNSESFCLLPESIVMSSGFPPPLKPKENMTFLVTEPDFCYPKPISNLDTLLKRSSFKHIISNRCAEEGLYICPMLFQPGRKMETRCSVDSMCHRQFAWNDFESDFLKFFFYLLLLLDTCFFFLAMHKALLLNWKKTFQALGSSKQCSTISS